MSQNLWCELVGHKFGEWTAINRESCEQIRSCKRCDYKEKQIIHEWSDWKLLPSQPCEPERICKRCETRATKDNHEWQVIKSDTSSEQIYRSPGNPVYTVVEIHYEVTTTSIYKCSTCGKEKTETTSEIEKYEVTQAGETRMSD